MAAIGSLVSSWLILKKRFSSGTAWSIGPKLSRKQARIIVFHFSTSEYNFHQYRRQVIYFKAPPFLAHLTQRVMWAILITWRPSSSSVVRRKLFQKSSPLKVLDQWKPNLVWIITRVSSFKIVSGDAVHQPTWPLLLKIEHMVKLQVFGNNSKTVSNIKNLTWGKNDQHIKIYLPCNFEVNLITHLGVIALFSSNL